MLTRHRDGYEALRDAPTNGTHHRDYPGQPTSHLSREHATAKQAPRGHPADSTPQRTQRALDRFPKSHFAVAMQRPAASPTTVPDCTHTRVQPMGPDSPSRSTPGSNALTVCTGSRSLHIGRVPGQPGLARPPAPQDQNPEDDTPRPRTPTP